MFNRMLLAITGALVLALAVAACSTEQPQETASVTAAPEKPAEPQGPFFELTKDVITEHPDWTSRNVMLLGAKLGDDTSGTKLDKLFGKIDHSAALATEYLTRHQNNSVAVYTFKTTGRARQFEIYDTFAPRIADPKLKKLLTSGDLKYLREQFGEYTIEENPENKSTEYVYENRGFRFVVYKLGNQTVKALRFSELRKPSATS